MKRPTSMIYAKHRARNAKEDLCFKRLVNGLGHLSATIDVDVAALHLKPGRKADVRILIYHPGSVGGNAEPKPVLAADNTHALAVTQTVTVAPGEEFVSIRVEANAFGLEGQWADLVVERMHGNKAPLAGAGIAALAIACGLALASWGDPAAKRGHYEGKTQEEIQADLDADVAWYAMEISVASAMTVPEGETTIEARIENPEANHCDQRVRILTAEGEELYASGAIKPGEYLQTVDLAHPLPVGTHTLTVEFQGYERTASLLSNEGVPLGHDTFGASCAAEVELTVVPLEE